VRADDDQGRRAFAGTLGMVAEYDQVAGRVGHAAAGCVFFVA
jgi:hypothetical protein